MPSPIPKTLYMYCPPKAVALFEKRRFKATSPCRLNDPFEFDPPVIGRASSLWMRKHLGGVVQQENVREKVAQHVRNMRDDLKVVCLSANVTDALSWALYADRHRGFVVGLGTDSILNQLVRVRYSQRRPRLNMKTMFLATEEENTKQWEQAVCTKSPEWKHEQEYRLIGRTRFAQHGVDENGAAAYYFRFPKGLITQVIIGSQCVIEKQIQRELRHPHFEKAQVLWARLACISSRTRLELSVTKLCVFTALRSVTPFCSGSELA
jgi:hypothetical protein